MGKRKNRQGFNDDVIDDDISTDDENRENSSNNQAKICPHVGKAVHVTSLKKALKATWLKVGACGGCAKENRNANAKTQGKVCLALPPGLHILYPNSFSYSFFFNKLKILM